MKRQAHPVISAPGELALAHYEHPFHRQKLASVNCSLIRLKRYFGWAMRTRPIMYDPSTAVKLVGRNDTIPRFFDDQEEQVLDTAMTKAVTLRDRVLIVLLFQIGLQVREICRLRRDQGKLGNRSSFLAIIVTRNKYREVALNISAPKVLDVHLPTLPPATVFLLPSGRTYTALTEHFLSYIIKNTRLKQSSKT